jgi:hypothetical protein
MLLLHFRKKQEPLPGGTVALWGRQWNWLSIPEVLLLVLRMVSSSSDSEAKHWNC